MHALAGGRRHYQFVAVFARLLKCLKPGPSHHTKQAQWHWSFWPQLATAERTPHCPKPKSSIAVDFMWEPPAAAQRATARGERRFALGWCRAGGVPASSASRSAGRGNGAHTLPAIKCWKFCVEGWVRRSLFLKAAAAWGTLQKIKKIVKTTGAFCLKARCYCFNVNQRGNSIQRSPF